MWRAARHVQATVSTAAVGASIRLTERHNAQRGLDGQRPQPDQSQACLGSARSPRAQSHSANLAGSDSSIGSSTTIGESSTPHLPRTHLSVRSGKLTTIFRGSGTTSGPSVISFVHLTRTRLLRCRLQNLRLPQGEKACAQMACVRSLVFPCLHLHIASHNRVRSSTQLFLGLHSMQRARLMILLST